MSEHTATIRSFIESDLLQGASISNDENLLLSGKLDSLAVMSLVAYVEKAFSISVPFDEVLIENFETVDAIASYVATKQAAG